MSVRRKLLTAYGAMALLALVVAGTTVYAIAEWGATNDALQGHYQRSLLLQRIRASAFRAFKEVPDAVFGGDADARQEFAALLTPVEEDFAAWSELAVSKPEQAQVRQVRERFDAIVADAETVFDLVDQGRRDEAFALMEGRLENQDFAPFEAVSNDAVESDRAYREVVREQVERTRRTAQLIVGLAAFGLVSLSLLVAAYLASDLFAPLREVRRGLAAVTGGDFDLRLDEERRDELGDISRAFNAMVAALAQRIRLAGLPDDAGAGAGDGASEAGEIDWRRAPSRVALHALVGQLRSRVARLDRDGATDGARETDQERRELVDELDQLAMAVSRLADFGFPLDLNLAPTDVRDLVYDVLIRFHDELARRGVSLELAIGPGVGEAVVDRLKLREVVAELVRNALAALPERGGRLGLRASVNPEGTELLLEVADDGAGVEGPAVDGAFAPFATTRPQHAGVGLTLAKATVEQHGGRLEFASRADHGTRVVVALTLRPRD